MPLVVEIAIFFVCSCFGVCGALWMYGDFAVRGEPGGIGLTKAALLALAIPALVLIAAVVLAGHDPGYVSALFWAVGLGIGVAVRLITRPAYAGPLIKV